MGGGAKPPTTNLARPAEPQQPTGTVISQQSMVPKDDATTVAMPEVVEPKQPAAQQTAELPPSNNGSTSASSSVPKDDDKLHLRGDGQNTDNEIHFRIR